MKTLHNSDVSGTKINVKDVKVFGNVDMFQLLCKASSESEKWMKSTKAMEVLGGCIIQVSTQQGNSDGSYRDRARKPHGLALRMNRRLLQI